MARRAEIDQHRRTIGADVDIRRLDVEVQNLVRMHFAQPLSNWMKTRAERFPASVLVLADDMPLQGFALLVLHHHVDGVVGAEKIHHLDHIRMANAGQRAAFLEETLHAVAKRGFLVDRNRDAPCPDRRA
jgi:hypothetical protein